MHRVHRQILVGICLLISLIITCNNCHKMQQRQQEATSWSPMVEQEMRDILYRQASQISSKEDEKQAYVDCCMEKIKAMFPNGFQSLQSGVSDSLQVAIMKMGAACSTSFKSNLNPWAPDVVEQLQLAIYSYPETKQMPQKMKKEYVDCITYKLMDKYPNGLSSADQDSVKKFITKQREKCIKMLVNKYGKIKQQKLDADTAASH